MTFGARARIRLDAIRQNYQVIRTRAPEASLMAVIKANAYGHGLVEVATALADADCFAVARLHEASVLREAGIETPIALLGGVLSEQDLPIALALDLQLGVHSLQQIEWLENLGRGQAMVWLKVDTGMLRLGVGTSDAPALIERLQACRAVGRLGVMTHFANADQVDDSQTRQQIDRFLEVVQSFDGAVSLANSPGLFGWSSALKTFFSALGNNPRWARPGLGLYGVSPFPDRCGKDLGLRPAMDFVSQLTAVKRLCKGDAVGYGGTWRARDDTVLGIVAAGYGDGYSRFIPAGTPVLVNGRRASVAGRVSMDLTAVDLGPGATDRPGDPVLLWGAELPVEEIARHAGTIPYELLCGVSGREPQEYRHPD